VATGAFVAPAFGGASARGVDYGGSGRSGAAFALGLVSRPSPAPAQAIFQATGSSTLAAAGLHAAATHAGISLAPAGRLSRLENLDDARMGVGLGGGICADPGGLRGRVANPALRPAGCRSHCL